MKNPKKNIKSVFIALLALAATIPFSSCKQWTNFTTYYNTYYNTNRLIEESEDEFSYQDEKKRSKPRVFFPEPELLAPTTQKTGSPLFLNEFVIDQQKLQPVQIKLDSVLIKGSKILAFKSKSNYVEGTLYLMAKAYFYRREWLPAQIKCSELIDRYPVGDLNPDAHLLLSKALLIQQKFLAGNIMLSRTVDIAWYKNRFDILSEAFRIEAEMALYENDFEGALRPYRQAIAQVEDETVKAKWKTDYGALLYRLCKFAEAERAFASVEESSPDYVTEFEAKLYRADCLARIGKADQALALLNKLDDDGKYEEWKANIYAIRMNMYRVQKNNEEYAKSERVADSAYQNQPPILAIYYEQGMDLFAAHDWQAARKYFAKSKNPKAEVGPKSEKMYNLLNNWESKKSPVDNFRVRIARNEQLTEGEKAQFTKNAYELGRIHEQLGFQDSVLYYYKMASDYSSPKDTAAGRYLYAYAQMIKADNPEAADSLMELIVERYPKTEHGFEAMALQGYTSSYLIDTVLDLYHSGSRLYNSNEFNLAITQFCKIYQNYPKSDYAPKSLYSIGWIFEKKLLIVDSALYYYSILIEKYPESEYAKDIKPSVDHLLAVRSGKLPVEPPKDTLKRNTEIDKIQKNKDLKLEDPAKGPQFKEKKPEKRTIEGQLNNWMNMTPEKVIENFKENTQIETGIDFKSNIPLDPAKLIEKEKTPDSTNTEKKELPENKLEEPK